MIFKNICSRILESQEFKSLKLESGDRQAIEGISPASFPIIISSLFYAKNKQIFVITENTQGMNDLYLDLMCFVNEQQIYKFPTWEIIPYEFMSISDSVERDRIQSIYKIISGAPNIIIATVDSVIRKIPTKSFFLKNGLTLSISEDYPFEDIVSTLIQYGYSRETKIDSFGQFSVKGSIIDIHLPTFENPVRLDFFGDTLESIREFDLDTQVSAGLDKHKEITIYPRRELILFSNNRDLLRNKLKKKFNESMNIPVELTQWLNGENDNVGLEDYFTEIIDSCSIIDFLSDDADIILLEWPILVSRKDKTIKNYDEIYTRKSKEIYCIKPDKLLDYDVLGKIETKSMSLQTFTSSIDSLNWNMKSIKNYHGKLSYIRDEIKAKISHGWKIILTTSFDGQARRLSDIFSDLNPNSDFETYSDKDLNIVLSTLSSGIELADIKIMIITDHEIFGKSYRKRKHFKSKSSRPIDTFLDLKPGDYIVHINHGIGIFKNIERMAAGGLERDFIVIDYADNDKLYVSLDQINLVQKYIGAEGRKPRIDALGKKSAWNRIKERVKESVEEIAKDLIKIYSKRSALKGFRYPPDTQWQEEFESLFEYEETPDQLTAIEDVKDDMESDKPMDRLVCGDVGFGKTEVAIRASFKAVMAGKQVVILAPTTILAMQHFNTFKKRFDTYPITIDMISRFRTRSEITNIKNMLKAGKIDIIIGTHAILGEDIDIKNLGLLIIDEEQRFGVKHKERLKKLRAIVDVLTLSATPIPRTLHISMAGIRDLTIISTPPENRQAIETYVLEENPDILRNAILNEINRNGQVYYVYNRVQTIETQSILLKKLVPEATFNIAHGQMDEHELEDIMIDFMNNKFNVLISTSIIESGLDIPNVNTIIINRADTFGLSQLYQLKGRVGRSTRQAYAYLFYPRHASLTEDAQKRLQVISEYTDLGSGFKIAMKDLEIRGAGNILGHQQSGNIMDVGFDLYCQMLENEIKTLKGEEIKEYFRTSLFIKTNFFIPDSYIDDDKQKIEFYKKFESCETEEEVNILESEMIDRFGQYTPEVKILVELERIRVIASAFKISEIIEENNRFKMRISSFCIIPGEKLTAVISKDKRLTLDPQDPELLLLKINEKEVEKKLSELKKWLQQFM